MKSVHKTKKSVLTEDQFVERLVTLLSDYKSSKTSIDTVFSFLHKKKKAFPTFSPHVQTELRELLDIEALIAMEKITEKNQHVIKDSVDDILENLTGIRKPEEL